MVDKLDWAMPEIDWSMPDDVWASFAKDWTGCVTCGAAPTLALTGGRRKYCCNAARQRAYRRRRRLLARAIGLDAARRRWVDYRTPFPGK